MRGLRRGLDLIVGTLCCVLLAGMVCILAWQVISRYLLDDPSTFSEEALRYGVIWLSLLGAAYSTGRGSHMAVDLVTGFARGRALLALRCLVPLSLLGFGIVVLGIGGWHGVEIARGQTSAVMRLPMSLIYASLPVSGVLMALYSALNLADMLSGTRALPDPVEQALTAGD
ncbi:TRAP transporter small permease [Pseudooceanicola sp. CBS1P-1]|uniref:TRAP transporter small permease protein n=1 Tax=Pseudooceanicola albus TaxID=2692189 RepID=A0A6L7G7U1_9RHOB|nr:MULTISPECIES: TRAP transporter small permease [Pseudooceanicola]MBT9385912.1 TRAP transporter small permease [Pseudooceanicola endophyticus]MXN19667.1 TRAP transporter small permease subunit [Pseudooceanicola albus]